MTTYAAPLRDMRFVLEDLCGLEEIARLPGLEEATPTWLRPCFRKPPGFRARSWRRSIEGDRQGSRLIDGVVRTPDRWQEAYTTFVEGAGTAP